MSEISISLLIVNFNTRQLLGECLRSIAAFCPGAEVIVVDNGSGDRSPAMVRDEFPRVKLLALAENSGFAAANNAGLALCTGEFVVLLNSDTFLEDESLDRCARWMREHPEVGAVSPRLIGVDGQDQQCLHPYPSLRKEFRTAFWLNSEPAPDPSSGWLAGTALMIRRQALADLDGFLDVNFWIYWEDADLSARLREAGWELGYVPEAHVRHYGGASGGGPDVVRRSDLYAWYAWGKHRWFAKHRPRWEAACLWVMDGLGIFRILMRGALRPSRRREWPQARELAGVLGCRLVGRAPRKPGR